MAYEGYKIAVVIPCYKVTGQVLDVIKSIPDFVDSIICVDDACPDKSGTLIKTKTRAKRITVLTHEHNKGVGGAVITGYKHAIEIGMDIAVKIDGDGQMNPALIPHFIEPIIQRQCDYTKGNRFFRVRDVKSMPKVRLFGNAALSFFSKLSSGHWHIFDPANGYTAAHCAVLRHIPLDHVRKRYFFESDMLYQLGSLRCAVKDVPMEARYGDEGSSLRVGSIFLPFLWGHIRNFGKRIFYNYILRDFNLASIEMILGLVLFVFGILFGLSAWDDSNISGKPATAGTVMLSALPLIFGVQMILSFLNYDVRSTPKDAAWPVLKDFFETKKSDTSI